MIVRVEVTAEDIEAALESNLQDCPVMRAINRAFETETAEVGPRIFHVRGIRHTLPDAAVKFVHDYDCGRMVQPFGFEVEGAQ